MLVVANDFDRSGVTWALNVQRLRVRVRSAVQEGPLTAASLSLSTG